MTTASFYEKNALSFYKSTIGLDMTNIYRPFLNLIKVSGHILDAGCGSGRDSKYFLEQGYAVTPFDSCQKLCGLASKHINREVFKLRFQELNFTEQFDGIWACASLLHVNREEIDLYEKRRCARWCGVAPEIS